MRTHTRLLLLFACSLALPAAPASAGYGIDLDSPPLNYGTARPDNPVAPLVEKVRREKKASLKHGDDHGYLASLLGRLDVPLSSQVLVFSKTSLQRGRISPKTPRAIYF